MRGIAAGVGVVLLSPFLLGGAAMVTALAGEAVGGSAGRCLSDPDTDGIAERVAAILDGADASEVEIEGLELPGEQIPHARTIVATGIGLQVPRRGQIVALATAVQESRLRNLDHGDRDSLGLFQQRPSQGWGTPEQIRDPVHASERFYRALLDVPGWEHMSVTRAAQAVQRSAYPDEYAQWEPLATALQQVIAAGFPATAPDSSEEDVGGGGALPGCDPVDDSGFGVIPEGAVPEGYRIPATADPRARTAITWAMHQLGTMYQWGGSCTAPHGPDPMGRCDCSSLVQQSYAKAGVELTRTTYTQVNEGRAVSPSAMEPGDLIFNRGTAARPEHVGMYLGEGLVIEAPRTGRPVRITPLADWDVLAVRRVL
ncbi:hypothetical protein FNQ90_22290 [Streptomyces alkaliphilus]|uniref:NlpC/P60 domain-containing protein n=1 Tax=Streptomyces alkaliphilus TaxID=1472722 RepID=A0A7W3TH51_9ACTN|nr:C40 family peptidase [Streptomyces alkaliphilus]MBB0246772.1 hypothetical protein [Streptomyces alkaliphilus]